MATATLSPGRVDLALDGAAVWPVLAPLVPLATTLLGAELIDRKEARALLRYRLHEPAGPGLVLAKLYSDVDQAARVHRTMRSLSEVVFAGHHRLTVPRPLGWLPQLGMVLYRPVPGVALGQLHRSELVLEGMAASARWLSVLHGSGLDLDRRLDVARETGNAALWAASVDLELRGRPGDASELARRLAAAGSSLPVGEDVPIHKDFHHQHAIAGPALGVVDLDEARLGDPNFDVAHFCANLQLLPPRPAGGLRERAQRVFLTTYAEHAGWRMDDRFPFFYALTCLKMAKQLLAGRGPAPAASDGQRRRHAAAALREGQSWLPS